MTAAALALLAGSAFALGSLALARVPVADLRWYERVALELTAGLGLTSLLLSAAALGGWFAPARFVVGALAIAGGWIAAGRVRAGATAPSVAARDPRWARTLTMVVFACAATACLGALAPVTDEDALAYVIPTARHVASTGALRVWPDQARSMWPQSHQVLLAFILSLGGDRLGALSALQWLLAAGAVSALARKACARAEHVPVALVIALGAPVTAFQVSSAKEDMFLLAAAAATGACLVGGSAAELVAAGAFAGLAAGAKYPGFAIPIAAVMWVCAVGRDNRLRAASRVAIPALLTGGLWYLLNLLRFGNPIAPFVFGAPGTPLDATVVQTFNDDFGAGRGLLAFVLAPARMFVQPTVFSGHVGLFNPLAYLGVVALAMPALRGRHAPLLFIAAVIYVEWFFALQNARLLLPAAVLLSPAASDLIVPAILRRSWLKGLAWAAAAGALVLLPLVGVVRVVRFAGDRDRFLERETPHYAAVRWMNDHLDPRVTRVGSVFKVIGYIDAPALYLHPAYELEIGVAEMGDADSYLTACRRQGVTHLFAPPDIFPDTDRLRLIYLNGRSRLGGTTLVREPATEQVAVFEILR